MKVIAVIQVRMGSQRLANKAFLPIHGKGAIERIAERLRHCKELDGVVLTTTDQTKDDVLANLAKKISIPCFRGSETDLIQRLLGAARTFKADAIVRVTGDCPLVDPTLVDRLAAIYRKEPGRWDMITNIYPPTFPDGLDLEVLPTKTLEKMDREVTRPLHREWLTTYVLENPQIFRITNVRNIDDLSALRWTLDFPEDLLFLRRVYRLLAGIKPVFVMRDILDLLARKPELKSINANRVDKTVVRKIRSHAYHQLLEKEAAATGEKK